MLELKSVTIKAGGFLLENVSFTAREGQCHIIAGPTGAGKTLLLETIIGFRKPLTGAVCLAGRNLNGVNVEQRGISYVPQDPSVFPHLNVEENILYGLRYNSANKDPALALKLAQDLKIDHLLERSTINLSGGEQQRVALVRALAPGNKYLLLDEPFSSLHESLKKDFWFQLKELQSRYKLTIVMITHDLEEAFFMGDTISLLINGQIRQSGSPNEIYRKPSALEVAEFMGIKNLFAAEVLDIGEQSIGVYSEDIGSNLVVSAETTTQAGKFVRGKKILVGIRSEEVMISRPEYQRRNQDNSIKGTITHIFTKGASHTIFFTPHNGVSHIEIELPNYALQKLQLSIGDIRIISLRRESVFLLRKKRVLNHPHNKAG